MISDLDGLTKYSESMAAKFQSIASEIRLCSPGCSSESLQRLSRAIPCLPDSYFDLVGRIEVFGVSIGQLNLWPVSFGGGDLVSSLIEANRNPSNPWLDFYNSNGVVEVARFEVNMICVGRKGSSCDGAVFLLDIGSGPVVSLKSIASSYEQLLIVAANLHEVSMNYDDKALGVREFQSRLARLGVEKSASIVWGELLEEAIF